MLIWWKSEKLRKNWLKEKRRNAAGAPMVICGILKTIPFTLNFLPPMAKQALSFLENYITEVLQDSGLGKLSEANQRVYVPQLAAEAEYRLGLELIPKLNEEQAKHFSDMVSAEESSPTVWQNFWKQAVPQFDAIVQSVLKKFAEDCRKILARS